MGLLLKFLKGTTELLPKELGQFVCQPTVCETIHFSVSSSMLGHCLVFNFWQFARWNLYYIKVHFLDYRWGWPSFQMFTDSFLFVFMYFWCLFCFGEVHLLFQIIDKHKVSSSLLLTPIEHCLHFSLTASKSCIWLVAFIFLFFFLETVCLDVCAFSLRLISPVLISEGAPQISQLIILCFLENIL